MCDFPDVISFPSNPWFHLWNVTQRKSLLLCRLSLLKSEATSKQISQDIDFCNFTKEKNLPLPPRKKKTYKPTTLMTAYRRTPQVTTGATPLSLSFGREMRTKLPELRGCFQRSNAKWSKKLKGKDYTDSKRWAVSTSFRVGDDVVLLKTEKTNVV